jgi:hypothetical protein
MFNSSQVQGCTANPEKVPERPRKLLKQPVAAHFAKFENNKANVAEYEKKIVKEITKLVHSMLKCEVIVHFHLS